MIDIKLVRTQPDMIRDLCKRRSSDVDVEKLISIDRELRDGKVKLEALRHEQKKISELVHKQPELREESAKIKAQIKNLEEVTRKLEAERDDLWSRLPNLLAPDTPDGKDDTDNVEIYQWGNPPMFNFEPKTHEILGKELDILDLERGAKLAGSGFYFWKGDGAKLAWAIFSLALDFLSQKGFTPLFTPVVAKRRTMFGTGYLPFSEDQVYKIEGEDLCLIGTSEQTLVGYHDDEILPADSLPLLYTAFTPCLRTEAGAGGKASRGAFRVHQFHKVEQIVFCRPEDSEKWHEECQKNAQELLQLLEIPYRVVRVCLGDLGAPGYKKYDLEGWFASFGAYRETHSNTNLLDYQTRRLNIRCKDGKKPFYPHTISATGITDRAALIIIENRQLADGSVVIPEALRPYMKGQEKISKPS